VSLQYLAKANSPHWDLIRLATQIDVPTNGIFKCLMKSLNLAQTYLPHGEAMKRPPNPKADLRLVQKTCLDMADE